MVARRNSAPPDEVHAAGRAGVDRAIGKWSEEKLDALQLPHPLLGNLTVREMLLFTLYHQRHHIDVVRRRLSEARSTAIPS